ncbi:tetratricopeptide repeat protein [Streptomyces sp. NPDC001155]
MRTTAERERRCAALRSAFEDCDAAEFRPKMGALTDELLQGRRRRRLGGGLHLRRHRYDTTDLGERAVEHYRKALDGVPDGGLDSGPDGGLDGDRRRQADIQPVSTLRTLGDPRAGAGLLLAEREQPSNHPDDAVTAFLALACVDLGRERDAACSHRARSPAICPATTPRWRGRVPARSARSRGSAACP